MVVAAGLRSAKEAVPGLALLSGRGTRRCRPRRITEVAGAIRSLLAEPGPVVVGAALRSEPRPHAGDQPAPAANGLAMESLLADPYFVVLPADHPLTAATEVRLADLADQRLVSAARNPLCPCGEAFQRFCANVGFQPRFAVEVDDYPTCQSLVGAGAGVGVATIPLLGLAPALHEGVVVRPLIAPRLVWRIYTVTRSTVPDGPLASAMLADLRRAADTLPHPTPEESASIAS